jgi:hypothetical protein
MTQDVVTARDAAAPSEIVVQQQDFQRICEVLDKALAYENFRRPKYSEQSASLLKLAWAVAAHKRSRQVTLFHLAYALIFDQPKEASELAQYLGTDIDSFAVGNILQILPLGVSTGDAGVLPPAVGTVRWLGHAAKLALSRGERIELLPHDLIRAVLDSNIPANELSLLKRASRVGAARRDAVLGPKAPNSPASTPKEDDPFAYIEKIEKGRDSAGSDELADLTTAFEDFDQRYTTDANEQKRAMAAVRGDMTRMDARIAPIDETAHMLAALDKKVGNLAASITRPPSGQRIAAAIIAVLLFGGMAGVTLTSLQPAQGVRTAPAAGPVIGKLYPLSRSNARVETTRVE